MRISIGIYWLLVVALLPVESEGSLALAFARYCHHQYCVVYGIKKGGSVGGRILRNGRALVLQ